MPLILNREDVKSVLSMKDCIDAVEKAFAELARGQAVLPLRLTIKNERGVSLYMPAYLKESRALACKVVSVFKDNPARFGLATTLGKVLLQDPESGDVLCIMDGGYLTAVRTGAASGVATRHLARSDKAQVAGIFGAGVQARMQLWAVKEVRELKEALVFDVSTEAAQGFAAEMGSRLGLEVKVVRSPQEVLEADIICTATTSAVPLFDGRKLREGTHINGIGSHSPAAREVDTETVRRCLLVGDLREACLNEAGDVMIPVQEGSIDAGHFYAELGEIIVGTKPGRSNPRQITFFKSNGLAVQDAAAVQLAYQRARQAGIGTSIEV